MAESPTQFHITPQGPRPCNATKRACKYSQGHFATEAEAARVLKQLQEEESRAQGFTTLGTMTAKQSQGPATWPQPHEAGAVRRAAARREEWEVAPGVVFNAAGSGDFVAKLPSGLVMGTSVSENYYHEKEARAVVQDEEGDVFQLEKVDALDPKGAQGEIARELYHRLQAGEPMVAYSGESTRTLQLAFQGKKLPVTLENSGLDLSSMSREGLQATVQVERPDGVWTLTSQSRQDMSSMEKQLYQDAWLASPQGKKIVVLGTTVNTRHSPMPGQTSAGLNAGPRKLLSL